MAIVLFMVSLLVEQRLDALLFMPCYTASSVPLRQATEAGKALITMTVLIVATARTCAARAPARLGGNTHRAALAGSMHSET